MTLDFSFSFDPGENPDVLLAEARKAVGAGSTMLGHAPGQARGPGKTEAEQAADALLEDLQHNNARFAAAQPVLQPLTPERFAAQGLTMGPDIAQLASTHRLYWLRIPYLLQAKADHRFERIELVIELNPGAAAAERPKIEAALPSSEFSNLAEAVVDFSLGIDESLRFAATVGSPPLPRTPVSPVPPAGAGAAPQGTPGQGAPAGGAGPDVVAAGPSITGGGTAGGNQAGKIGFVAGPFHYRVRKAVVERSNLGTERVFWRISSGEKLEDPPELVAVIAVPNGTHTLEISAALQAYASARVLQMTLGNFFVFLGARLKHFFSAGAPRRDTKAWDLTSQL